MNIWDILIAAGIILLACAAVLLWLLWDKSDKDFDDIRERLRNKEHKAE